MTFINLALVGGTAACSIPLIIHLFNRSRFKIVQWGAMFLLDPLVRTNRRRIKLEQIILLIVRMMIPALIALFMARPVLTGFDTLPGDKAASQVVLLDNSYSMEAGGESASPFARARRETGDLVANLKNGSDASVVLMAGGSRALFEKPSYDMKGLGEKVAGLQGGYGVARPVESIERALATIGGMSNSKRDLVVLSDFQAVSWGAGESAERKRLRGMIDAMAVKPTVTFFALPAPDADNLSIESLQISPQVVGVKQPLQVKAVLRNHGKKAYEALRVRFRVDGADQAASEVAVGPGERAQVLFSETIDTPGSHTVEIACDADALKADNVQSAAVSVWDRVPVLLVSGETSDRPLRGETDYLEVALRPFGSGGSDLKDLIEPKVVVPAELTAKALEGARVVVLANVSKLEAAAQQLVEGWVRAGGGLLVFPGARSDAGWYGAAASSGLLPMAIGGPAGSTEDRAQQTAVVAEHFAHPALELFNIPANGTLADGEVWMWWRLRAPTGAETREGTLVLARLATGDAFLAEHKFGEGRVILCATACDADWANLPMRPSFLPLTQRLTTYLASGAEPPRNVEVGKPLVALLPPAKAGTLVGVTTPSGERFEVQAREKGPRSTVEFFETHRPGLYLMSAPQMQPIHFVASASREESRLDPLTDDQLAAVAAEMGADVVRSGEEYRRLDSQRRYGREIWRAVFLAALAMIFVELILQHLFSKRSL